MTEPEDDEPTLNLSLGAAFLFEMSLAVAAFVIGWVVDWSPARTLVRGSFDEGLRSMAIGFLAALPLAVVMLALEPIKTRNFERLREVVQTWILPWLREATDIELLLLCLSAGLGEELLFRGLVQDGLTQLWGGGSTAAWGALLAASALFAVCHWLTHTYAVLAGLVSLYFGGLLWCTGGLLAPITAHTVYDFLAIYYLLNYRDDGREPAED